MQDARAASEAALYDDDFFTWTRMQAEHIRQGNLARVDFANVAEEIESLGKSQESELLSRYKVLCLHLLKQIVQPERDGRSWRATIAEQRALIAILLRKNPALRPKKVDLFADGYAIACKVARAETGLALDVFPLEPPFSLSDAEDEAFLPVAMKRG